MRVPETELVFTQDGAELMRTTLVPGEYVIGRNPDVDVRVRTERISRRHARLTINFQEVFMEDLGSSNGTFVAGEQIKECTRVFPNQIVNLGSVRLELFRQRFFDPEEAFSPHAQTLARLLPPEYLGDRKYVAGRVIAHGGMGVILEGEEKALRRKIAIKRMLNANSEDDIVRFVEEAQITAQLDHPNIVPLYEIGIDEHEQLYYTMKLVRGVTLTQVLREIRQGNEKTLADYPLAVLLGIFQKACDALAYAHSKGVLHRDLKPDNIMLGEYGEVMVMDWGLARASGKAHGSGPQRSFVRSARQEVGQHTMMGFVFGSPQYMSPEQARGESNAYDARTDVYALGATLYHILTLEPPVSGEDVGQMLLSVATGNVGQFINIERGPKEAGDDRLFPHLPGGKIPPTLATITRKAMALSQADRYESVQQLQADLEEYQGGVARATSAPSETSTAGGKSKLLLAIIGVLAIAVLVLVILLLKKP
jgi:serine/threonine protein kinase